MFRIIIEYFMFYEIMTIQPKYQKYMTKIYTQGSHQMYLIKFNIFSIPKLPIFHTQIQITHIPYPNYSYSIPKLPIFHTQITHIPYPNYSNSIPKLPIFHTQIPYPNYPYSIPKLPIVKYPNYSNSIPKLPIFHTQISLKK